MEATSLPGEAVPRRSWYQKLRECWGWVFQVAHVYGDNIFAFLAIFLGLTISIAIWKGYWVEAAGSRAVVVMVFSLTVDAAVRVLVTVPLAINSWTAERNRPISADYTLSYAALGISMPGSFFNLRSGKLVFTMLALFLAYGPDQAANYLVGERAVMTPRGYPRHRKINYGCTGGGKDITCYATTGLNYLASGDVEDADQSISYTYHNKHVLVPLKPTVMYNHLTCSKCRDKRDMGWLVALNNPSFLVQRTKRSPLFIIRNRTESTSSDFYLEIASYRSEANAEMGDFGVEITFKDLQSNREVSSFFVISATDTRVEYRFGNGRVRIVDADLALDLKPMPCNPRLDNLTHDMEACFLNVLSYIHPVHTEEELARTAVALLIRAGIPENALGFLSSGRYGQAVFQPGILSFSGNGAYFLLVMISAGLGILALVILTRFRPVLTPDLRQIVSVFGQVVSSSEAASCMPEYYYSGWRARARTVLGRVWMGVDDVRVQGIEAAGGSVAVTGHLTMDTSAYPSTQKGMEDEIAQRVSIPDARKLLLHDANAILLGVERNALNVPR